VNSQKKDQARKRVQKLIDAYARRQGTGGGQVVEAAQEEEDEDQGAGVGAQSTTTTTTTTTTSTTTTNINIHDEAKKRDRDEQEEDELNSLTDPFEARFHPSRSALLSSSSSSTMKRPRFSFGDEDNGLLLPDDFSFFQQTEKEGEEYEKNEKTDDIFEWSDHQSLKDSADDFNLPKKDLPSS